MINQCLNVCFFSITSLFQAIAMDEILQADKEKSTKWFRITVWILMMLAGICVRVFVNDHGRTQSFTMIHGLAIYFIQFKLFYRDSFWKKLAVMIAIFFGTSLSEIGLLVVLPYSGLESMLLWDFKTASMLFLTMVGTMISVFGIVLVTIVMKKILYRGEKLKNMWIFVMYAISQTGVFLVLPYMYEGGVINYPIYYSLTFSLVSGFGIAFLIVNQSQKELVEREIIETNQEIELENEHFQNVSQRRRELEHISQGHTAFVHNIEGLLDDNKVQDAEHELMCFLEKLEATREYPYCNIPIINVILTEKIKKFRSEGFKIETDINIREEIQIKQTDFCSVLGNILDNALRACRQLQKQDVENDIFVKLKAKCVGEYLIIECENSCQKDQARFEEGSGYGLKILKDITERYHGNLRVTNKKNTFIIQISLMIKEL